MYKNDLIYSFVTILMVALILFGVYKFDEYSCKAQTKALGYTCKYTIFTGCVAVKPDGTKALLKQLREFQQ